ncbi:MAG: hypothetical protein AAGE89_09275 [Pseudomonadota bacterium]
MTSEKEYRNKVKYGAFQSAISPYLITIMLLMGRLSKMIGGPRDPGGCQTSGGVRVPFGSQAVGELRTAERLTAAAASSRGACYTSLRAPAFLWPWFSFLNSVLLRRFGARHRVTHARRAVDPATASPPPLALGQSLSGTPAISAPESKRNREDDQYRGHREPVRHHGPGETPPRPLRHASRKDLERIIATLPHTAPRFLHAAGLLKAKYKVRLYG